MRETKKKGEWKVKLCVESFVPFVPLLKGGSNRINASENRVISAKMIRTNEPNANQEIFLECKCLKAKQSAQMVTRRAYQIGFRYFGEMVVRNTNPLSRSPLWKNGSSTEETEDWSTTTK